MSGVGAVVIVSYFIFLACVYGITYHILTRCRR